MSFRDDFLRTRLRKYIDRRTMPQGFAGNIEAQQAEIAALLAVLSRHAPRDGLDAWWPRFEAVLGENAKTRAWPSENEIATAAKQARPQTSEGPKEPFKVDALDLNARRMNAGEAVGDSWLYGHYAVALERSGLVTKTTMRQYRSALYFRFKEVYGEDVARDMERALIARHEIAEKLDDTTSYQRDTSAPKPKRAHTPAPRYEQGAA